MLNASIMKASTTLIELSQPPDFGNLFNTEGNKANMVNGRAKANPNPNIPIVGLSISPLVASTNKTPIIGPVHENATKTVVSPMKNDESTPPLSTLESALLTHFDGRIISKAPKNEAAKSDKQQEKDYIRYPVCTKSIGETCTCTCKGDNYT